MNQPKISIVVPVHNTEEYLEKCLDSIIYQNYSNVEVIVIDSINTIEEDELKYHLYKELCVIGRTGMRAAEIAVRLGVAEIGDERL